MLPTEKTLTGEVHDGMTVRVGAASDRLVFEPLVTGVAQAA